MEHRAGGHATGSRGYRNSFERSHALVVSSAKVPLTNCQKLSRHSVSLVRLRSHSRQML